MTANTWVPNVLLMVGVLFMGQVSGYDYSSYVFNDMCNGGRLFSNIGAILIRMEEFGRNVNNCTVSINTGETRQIMARFRRVDMGDRFDTCRSNSLNLYDGKVREANRITGPDGVCGYDPPSQTYFTEGNVLNIRYIGQPNEATRGFELVLTDNTWDFSCNDEGFICDDGRCIDEYLKCDGWENCADGSDEECEGPDDGNFFLTPWVIGGFSVAGLLVLGLCVAILTVTLKRFSKREKYTNLKG